MTCQGWAGRIFGHKFRPRFSHTEREAEWMKVASFTDLKIQGDPRKLFVITNDVYVADVCERCGETYGRTSPGRIQPTGGETPCPGGRNVP